MVSTTQSRRLGWAGDASGAPGVAPRRVFEALVALPCAGCGRTIPSGARFTRHHLHATGRLLPVCRACAPFVERELMAYMLTCYGAGGAAAGRRVGASFPTADAARRAAELDAVMVGRVIRAWTDDARDGGLTWARGVTTDAELRYVVERAVDD